MLLLLIAVPLQVNFKSRTVSFFHGNVHAPGCVVWGRGGEGEVINDKHMVTV